MFQWDCFLHASLRGGRFVLDRRFFEVDVDVDGALVAEFFLFLFESIKRLQMLHTCKFTLFLLKLCSYWTIFLNNLSELIKRGILQDWIACDCTKFGFKLEHLSIYFWCGFPQQRIQFRRIFLFLRILLRLFFSTLKVKASVQFNYLRIVQLLMASIRINTEPSFLHSLTSLNLHSISLVLYLSI